ncbi:MAG: choice-of-anchor B family protein [Planctomycetes bacterium]|nr:choice-of-anchor B family protein [Planctomycetota bacterium]
MSRRKSTVGVLAGGLGLGLFVPAPAVAGFPSENVSMYSHLTLADFGATFAEDSWGYVSPSGREYAIIGISTGTGFVEITDPTNPVIVDIRLQANQGRDMKVYQNYVYSSSDDGPTYVYDVSEIDSGLVTRVHTFNAGTHNLAVDEVSGFLYLAIGGPMDIYDLSDPAFPDYVGTWPGQTHDAQVVTYTEGPYAGRQIAFVFAGWEGRVDIVDVTDKANIFLVGQTSYPSPVYTHHGWLTADRQILYVLDEVDELARTTIIDVSDLTNPTFISDFPNSEPSTDHNLYVHNGFIFEANYSSGLRVYDASDPLNPFEVGFFDTFPDSDDPGYIGAWNTYPFFPSGTVIVSDRAGGLFVLDVSAILPCQGDANGDGVVDPLDSGYVLARFGCPVGTGDSSCDDADQNGDGTVDPLDSGFVLARFGDCL